MALTWRSFDFFDATKIKIADDETRALFESNAISSVCSGSDSLFLGTYDGHVHIVGRSWKIVRTFKAYETGPITHMRQVEGTSLLVTVAEEPSTSDAINQPLLKVWALDKPAKKTGIPTCLSTVAINNGKKPFPISAFTATEDLSQLAVGFANGAVTVIRGDLIHDLGTKQRIIYESDEPITGVELRVDANITTLFIATTSRILKLAISGKGHGQPPRTVEDQGCGVGCMSVDKETGDIVVGRDDAIYYYTLDGRGPPIAYEAPKKLVSVYQDYIALVSPPTNTGESDTMRRRFWGATADSIFTFTLIHPDLRIIAHSESVLSDVKHIVQIWGDLFTITQEGQIFRYHQKSLQQRLDMLYQRNLYTLAVELAQKSGMDAHQQCIIFRKYGDYLYQKGNYDEAMTQYIKAIDTTEPSQVIRKFLDTQRIHNLIEYLEELHERGKATSDHTTLLLNCYAKLKDVDKLEKFIKSPGDLKFDLDTAISMCRQGGYYDQAAYLAKKHGENELVVDILIEDSKAFDDALDFIWHLDPDTAYACLMKYARVLIEHCSMDATRLFVDYYTSKYKPRIDPPAVSPDAPVTNNGGGFVTGAANAVQNLSNLLPLPYMNPLAVGSNSQTATKPTVGDAEVVKPQGLVTPTYTPPRPRTAFSSFIDHPDEFIIFLEALLKEGTNSLSEADKIDIHTTLFEMYLHKANEKPGNDQHREEWESKAKSLIISSPPKDSTTTAVVPPPTTPGALPKIENSNVLLLSHLASFRTGTVLMQEQSNLLFDIFRSYTSARDTKGAIRALHKYGPSEPQLYPLALSYLTSSPTILSEAGEAELSAILEKIDRDGLMAPLQVVQTLSKHGVATMGMLKPYLQGRIERERKEIRENRRDVEAFRKETEQRRQELEELETKPQVFQATRCGVCGGGLERELPVVHFLCRHSFHGRCLRGVAGVNVDVRGGGGGREAGEAAEGGECPLCAKDNATIRALKKSQEENAERHELFRDDLERSEDRFKTVAQWFGRGVMSVPNVE
ncbi:vacuolar protein sorting-associated protein 11 [Neurospora hispaniola]|uniref:E3 ubiquitin-protein ligase PEP5 n=1 Tax=Neurospora hispaniola TaxID=588809 RepID=A0AAJ0MQ51_9PEZI|nr:vacuolar protein sorting-associated protein 11 [Neurospora hispaniola]